MFVEKYRPKSFEEVAGLDKSIISLVSDDMPHFLFMGSAGTGKTTTAKIIINKTDFETLRLNGSDERGIDTIRNKVKEFAMSKSLNGKLKIVFIDEMDYLTNEAQAILRNLMETYAANCRFIFTANYGNKIIEALHSRCAKFEFKMLEKPLIFERLKFICLSEKIVFEDEAIKFLVDKYYPDMRSMINKLEELSKKGSLTVDKVKFSEEKIYDLIKLLKEKKFVEARLFFLNANDEPNFVLNQLFLCLLKDQSLSTLQKLSVIDAIAETDYRLGFSLDKDVQVSAGLVRIMKALV